MALDKIKRNFTWLRKALGIIDKTTLPGLVDGDVRVVMDLFGWDRLPESQEIVASNPNTTQVSTAAFTDEGVLRLILLASTTHSDVGINHTMWITKRNPTRSLVVTGVPTDRDNVDSGEQCSMIGHTFLTAGEILIGNTDIATQVGTNMIITTSFVDLPFGEYFPAM